jgi:hypothetical protein
MEDKDCHEMVSRSQSKFIIGDNIYRLLGGFF